MSNQALLDSITPVNPIGHSIVGKAVLYNVYHPTYICNNCIANKPLPETVPTYDLTLAASSQVQAKCVRCWCDINLTQKELDQLQKKLQTREEYDRASTEYQAVAFQLASIYQIGSTTPEIELLINHKAALEDKLATLANSLQTTNQIAISYHEMFNIRED